MGSNQSPRGRFLVEGDASAQVVATHTPLSFMMGVSAKSGIIQDKHHPLVGVDLKSKAFVLPCGRGSCSGSGVILELLLQDVAPAALILRKADHILGLGVMLSKVMYQRSIPVVLVDDDEAFEKLLKAERMEIKQDGIHIGKGFIPLSPAMDDQVNITDADRAMLDGKDCSEATRMAMQIIVAFAAFQGATSLIDVSQVHIDACCYVGDSSFLIPQRLHDLGGKFAVPSTCNSLDVDKQRWKQLGADPELSKIASNIGDLYLAMGSVMSFTCAPYTLDTAPNIGEQVGWGESNAVVYANSVLGARTQKYPDYLDVMIALTGRAPYSGCHSLEGRQPRILITVPRLECWDNLSFPLLGYHIGEIVGSDIPLIYGLEESKATTSNLKDFSAAFGTTSSAPMFHMNNITPETLNGTIAISSDLPKTALSIERLHNSWSELNSARSRTVGLVSLGNPHFTLSEMENVADLCKGRKKHRDTQIMITTNRHVYSQAAKKGLIEPVETFGAQMITDTCWCMISEPVIPIAAQTIMTNSAKYAHYGPGITKKGFHFGNIESCIRAACSGVRDDADAELAWLFDAPGATV